MKPIIILDPGHGMGNRRAGRYDPGAVAGKVTEADIVMAWANEMRDILRYMKVPVIRTRVNAADPCHVSRRAQIARDYHGTIMISLHCNAANGRASGTETFYRGDEHKAQAARLNAAVCTALGTKSRGVKTENDSQHATLAVMSFQPCFLIELGFIDHAGDRAKMLDPELRRAACAALVSEILDV